MAYADADTPLLHTRNGTYTGIYSPNYDQDFFLGVPYAQPPVENLRWRLPQSINNSFTGTREAAKYPPNCIGLGGDSWGYPLSEDCLYLNIIRPHVSQADQAGTQDEPLPIAVWIHGGGFYMGGSGDLRFNMSMIVDNAQKAGTPFIAISLNYRLNGFGFLYSNEIRGEGATNLGLRDQRLALHWIQENARQFGGDPRKVTIWGQSCGGNSVGFHMLAYGGRDDGLFSAGIMQSGNPEPWRALNGTEFYQPLYHNVTEHVHPSPEYAAANDMTSEETCANAADSLACLRTGKLEELNAVFNGSRDISQKWFPIVDGDFLREYPSRQLSSGSFVRIPIITGATTNEGHWFVPPLEDKPEDFLTYIKHPQVFTGRPYQLGLPAKLADRLFETYWPSICPDAPDGNCTNYESPRIDGMSPTYLRASTFAGDAVFIAPRRSMCEAAARFGMPAYCYRFDAIPHGQQAPTHFHEVSFVFDNTKGLGYHLPIHPLPFTGKPDSYLQLAKLISRSWVSFIVDHDPNSWRRQGQWDGIEPEWPVYGKENPHNFVFKPGQSHLEPDTFRKEQIRLINDNAHIFQR
ncbi:Carboxylesterase, type B [Akanthomyces lecanii RCEF 1005]|uniref:Carboxylesterase, type B n=1 Tax=Akanthomyces lecanii RCEF 1005 TaxID=1081108 RepID=A0A168JHF0_CORDF|nr:Carboxylesterase, type B [Akanthomyces lecanii RCEF 1005]